jgi:hypothetical protein
VWVLELARRPPSYRALGIGTQMQDPGLKVLSSRQMTAFILTSGVVPSPGILLTVFTGSFVWCVQTEGGVCMYACGDQTRPLFADRSLICRLAFV